VLFQVKFLALSAQVEADKVAQMFQGELALDLEFEGERPVAVGPGLLPHLHHHFTGLGFGEDQLTPN
jgi:hypothetical protein